MRFTVGDQIMPEKIDTKVAPHGLADLQCIV